MGIFLPYPFGDCLCGDGYRHDGKERDHPAGVQGKPCKCGNKQCVRPGCLETGAGKTDDDQQEHQDVGPCFRQMEVGRLIFGDLRCDI